MRDEIITGTGGSSAVLRGILIAVPFFLFLYYVKASSEKIKELKEQIILVPATNTTIQDTPQITYVLQRDTTLINENTDLINKNTELEQRVDSVLKLLAITIIPVVPPADNGDIKMFRDSFNIYKRQYYVLEAQLKECRDQKGQIRMNMKNYRPIDIIK